MTNLYNDGYDWQADQEHFLARQEEEYNKHQKLQQEGCICSSPTVTMTNAGHGQWMHIDVVDGPTNPTCPLHGEDELATKYQKGWNVYGIIYWNEETDHEIFAYLRANNWWAAEELADTISLPGYVRSSCFYQGKIDYKEFNTPIQDLLSRKVQE